MILKFSFIDRKFHLKHQQKWIKVIPNINEATGKWNFYKWLMGEYLFSFFEKAHWCSVDSLKMHISLHIYPKEKNYCGVEKDKQHSSC